jgi:hypothetical protein
VNECPRCGEDVAQGQEYCLECGWRLPGAGLPRVRTTDPGRGWQRRALVGLAVALAGGAAAVAATGGTAGGDEEPTLVTAIGGFATSPTTSTTPDDPGNEAGLLDWPAGQDGWTIALATLPQTKGKQPALARARDARRRGLTSVGILDSSRYASLHAGYWVVFAGIYSSEAEATSALEPAREFARTASVRHVVQ